MRKVVEMRDIFEGRGDVAVRYVEVQDVARGGGRRRKGRGTSSQSQGDVFARGGEHLRSSRGNSSQGEGSLSEGDVVVRAGGRLRKGRGTSS